MQVAIEDIRIQKTTVALPPVFLEEERPVSEEAVATIFNTRLDISRILAQLDSRLLVLVGPCSIHDVKAAREYAALLKTAIDEFAPELRIVMRVYFEKPRTTVGWKGLINDPFLDNSYRINDGLRLARNLLLDLAEMGVPSGTEFLDMISPQYIAGLVGWGAIGHVDLEPASCGDETCEADHGYTGTFTADDLSLRISEDGDGAPVVAQAMRFAGVLSDAVATVAARPRG